MATLPETVPFDVLEAANADYPSDTFLIDKEAGVISKVGGGLAAMEQAVQIILNVERYAYQIYSPNFGSELNSLIGRPAEYAASMLKRRIQEAFAVDSRILSVDHYVFEERMGTVKCSFEVKTIYGLIQAEVEI